MTLRAMVLATSAILAWPQMALAQDSTTDEAEPQGSVIIVTAQRQSQSLQEVPIAVSAFDATALESQQIENAADLQLTLPNVSFSKGNFTGSSFTIRGIGDLCVGVTCDAATAIHINGSPLFGTRLFETEYFDLERIEVLRGPQGTLFGRNATSGVVNLVTAKPDLGSFGAAGEFEYGNYNSIKAEGVVNVPIGDSIGVRVAGFFLNRDGYTTNLFDNSDVDDRDMYAVRGSLRFEPGADTTLDFMAYYFREDDTRLRNQKQACQRDPLGVLGCLNNRRDFDITNANSTVGATLSSQEFFAIQGIPSVLGLGSLYGPDAFAGFDKPDDVRTVNTAYTPFYFADEVQLQARLEQRIGAMTLTATGLYQDTEVDSRQDYFLGIQDRTAFATALNVLSGFAANGLPTGLPAPAPAFVPGSSAYFTPIVEALIPNGPGGVLCTSDNDDGNRGAFEGNVLCGETPLSFDRSSEQRESWSGEILLSSDFDGAFNFLLGGIYAKSKTTDNSYYVNSFALDYASAILGSFGTLAGGAPPSYFATSMYRNNSLEANLESFGVFGEIYVDLTERLTFTGGLRYNDDKKDVTARTTLISFLNPYANDGEPFDSPITPLTGPSGLFDADPGTPGEQLTQFREVGFDEITGRAVLDYEVTPDNSIYASYARGYKSGGINPPLSPVFDVAESFGSETIDAFEIGSKNTFANGALQLNATAFYYKYSGLQLSRIVARTSVNDTIDADIWGVELESVIRPDPDWLVNLTFSYLNAEVAGDQFFSNPRDPGGGDPDAVIIKDISNGANCAVTGPAPGVADAFVAGVNAALGLRGPEEFPNDGNLASSGAFSICDVLAGAVPAGSGLAVLSPGVEVNLKGNKLPQAPEMKVSMGVQYTATFDNGMTLVPRVDVALTGEQYGNIFNGRVNRIEPFVQANAIVQLNSADERWFVRGFVQNIFDSSSVTGLYLTDASSGNFTNIYTLDPRRYGVALGFSF
ncbi:MULTISPECIES: TonB-dependent receptor [Erythrobacteraceae]|jgi:iron complex outermembrane recepter protein|uniref:TonB-dependent receptor n=1 Tax=Qipengyuania flava TaxID=192812 RepID=A0A222ERW9_9SPHN|nr:MULTISPECIES: TonB-dependent receptor [Erythrobacteraceae]KZX52606.1 TonB-dependent receptor [Erythrobacter sp. HI00D59]KZX87639.1 TonB-dependent receptor [Erythrobacter sp. HI0020]KZY14878.1 TonB-dependent receptor [Erythrobacter sp. HI0037]MEC7952800.1 TonB-dependent receptor [Pseudomonadota bacterium]QPL40721.1 TonB-dependent receptor [Erythrobacter sp. A30-3]